jgi:LemA protein
VENYPDLKANANFQQLQRTLEEKENGIRGVRNQFNTAINEYNVKVRSFPMNLLAGIFGYSAKTGFQADAGADRAPEVKF